MSVQNDSALFPCVTVHNYISAPVMAFTAKAQEDELLPQYMLHKFFIHSVNLYPHVEFYTPRC